MGISYYSHLSQKWISEPPFERKRERKEKRGTYRQVVQTGKGLQKTIFAENKNPLLFRQLKTRSGREGEVQENPYWINKLSKHNRYPQSYDDRNKRPSNLLRLVSLGSNVSTLKDRSRNYTVLSRLICTRQRVSEEKKGRKGDGREGIGVKKILGSRGEGGSRFPRLGERLVVGTLRLCRES